LRKLHLKQTIFSLLLSTITIVTCVGNVDFNCNLTNNALQGDPIKTIVIDAGHGGKDSGCVGHHSQEKHIALKIALLLGDKIRSRFPGIKVIFTRTDDTFIPLNTRAKIANQNKADLFISIHCNAFKSSKVRGTETYVMGLHRAEENLAIAKRENSSVLMENDYEVNYDWFDPDSPEGHIFLSMFQNTYLDKSIAIAAEIEEEFSIKALAKSRGVKQAGFVVLRKATMPSILVETGYLTNKKDAAFLNTNDGQHQIVDALVNGLDRYIQKQKSNSFDIDESAYVVENAPYSFREESTAPSAPSYEAPTIQKTNPVRSSTNVKKKKSDRDYIPISDPKAEVSYKHNPQKGSFHKKQETTVYNEPVASPPSKPLKHVQHTKLPPQRNSGVGNPNNNHSSSSSRAQRGQSKFFAVQIAATKEKVNPIINMGLKDVAFTTIYEDGLYKYISGHFDNMVEAYAYRDKLQEIGVKGAFLVAYNENIRLKIEKAQKFTHSK